MICQHCGKEFQKRRVNSKFCSIDCCQQNYNYRRRMKIAPISTWYHKGEELQHKPEINRRIEIYKKFYEKWEAEIKKAGYKNPAGVTQFQADRVKRKVGLEHPFRRIYK